MIMTNIRTLECAVCGAPCRNRQWWNRDTGYGVCTPCGDRETAKHGAEEVADYYGVNGINWGVEP
jgi:hypothetical protein